MSHTHIEIIEGSGGIFKVVVNDEVVYDKSMTSRFPNPHEVINNMKEAGLI